MTTTHDIVLFVVEGNAAIGTVDVTVLKKFVVTVEDDDALGIGDDRGSFGTGTPDYRTETGAAPRITAISDPDFARYIGSEFYFGGDRNVEGESIEDALLLPFVPNSSGSIFPMRDPTSNSHSIIAFRQGAELPEIGQTLSLTIGTKSPGVPASNGNVEEVFAAVCFTRGTKITTTTGNVPIEELSPGDLVMTDDHGAQPIRYISYQRFDKAALAANPKLLPLRVKADALGSGVPARDLTVSRQHCLVFPNRSATRAPNPRSEILIPAIRLSEVGLAKIIDVEAVEYFNLLFDRHEIVFANGARSESLYLGPMTCTQIDSGSMTMTGDASQDSVFTPWPQQHARQVVKTAKEVSIFFELA